MEDVRPVRYAGFWIRLAAALIDFVLLMVIAEIVSPVPKSLARMNDIVTLAISALLVLVCWWVFGTTLGKRMCRLRIVDERTLRPAGRKAFALRLFGYFLSWAAFLFGFIQIAFHEKHRGFHDRFAGTSVIHIQRSA